ncbi:MAG: hypothetical protein LBK72_06535 [Bifidobacteriaceae bacterium]|nr:hypothetical protein [Bifidobacteriaceae bacterium]
MTTTSATSARYTVSPGTILTRNRETGAMLALFPNGRTLRLSPKLGHLCEAVASAQGPMTNSDCAAWAEARGWDSAVTAAGLRALTGAGILRTVTTNQTTNQTRVVPVHSRRTPRIEFRPPLTVRFTMLDPQHLCRVLAPLARLLQGPVGLIAAIIGFSLQCVVTGSDRVRDLPDAAPLAVIGLVSVTCAVHEFAHGIALAYAGGRPRRMGVMLFYLVPAFFCDVADSFTLSRRDQVHVALAGVVAQCHIGGLLVPLSLTSDAWGASLACYFRLNVLMVLVNLVPFVALDGYFALRAIVGIPNLRTTALEAWRSALLHRPGRGGHIPAHSRNPRWLVAFGAGASLFPLVMATFSVSAVVSSLPIDAPARPTIMLGALLAWACTQCFRWIHRQGPLTRRPSPSPARATSVLTPIASSHRHRTASSLRAALLDTVPAA